VIVLCMSVISILLGFFLILRPMVAFNIQRKFYEKINWRIEPISMQKEIRNTKLMGLFLVGVTIVIVIYALIEGYLNK